MACRGVYFALTSDQEKRLLALPDDGSRIEFIQEDIEEAWDEAHLQETDKAWDAIHRCLTGRQDAEPGQLQPDAGDYPLNQCVLGGKALYSGEDYIIHLIDSRTVRDLAVALEPIDKEWMRKRYEEHCKGAWPEFGPDDFEYTWEWFSGVREFFGRMAPTGRSVLFTVDL